LDLHRSSEDTKAVQGANFDVEEGEIFSLLDSNGVGKTTTNSMFSCLLHPDEGEARVMGTPSKTIQRVLKQCWGRSARDRLIEDLGARENLTFWGKMYGLRGWKLKKRVDEVLGIIGLSDPAKERIMLLLFLLFLI